MNQPQNPSTTTHRGGIEARISRIFDTEHTGYVIAVPGMVLSGDYDLRRLDDGEWVAKQTQPDGDLWSGRGEGPEEAVMALVLDRCGYRAAGGVVRRGDD